MTTTKPEVLCSRWNPKPLGTMATAILIFLSAGMNMAQGLGWSLLVNSQHFRYSWFVGVIVGSILSLPFRYFVPEKFILALSSVLILIEGIVFTSDPNDNDALLAGLYLNGIAVGLATVTFLIYASEISLNSHRGVFLGIEQFSVTVGIAIQMIYTSQWSLNDKFSPHQLHGILDVIFAFMAGGFIWLFIESPIDYLRWGDDEAAMDCLNRLQSAQTWRLPTNVIFIDLREYVKEQENYSWLESLQKGALPFIKMLFFRTMMLAFTFSLPLNVVLQLSTVVNLLTWPPVVAACVRIFGCVIACLVVDKIARKLPSLFCGVVIGALMLGIGIVSSSEGLILNSHKMSLIASFCLMIQFFGGIYAPFTAAYVGEAFPLKVKPYLIALCVIMEHVIQIIIICYLGTSVNSTLFIVQGILILVAFAGLCVTMPETRKTSLREAQLRFRRLFDLKMY